MKPILFNTEMVRAILDGRKTVTRRVIKTESGEPLKYGQGFVIAGDRKSIGKYAYGNRAAGEPMRFVKPPYKVNNILYVRETWCSAYDGEKYFYLADKVTEREQRRLLDYNNVKWRPSIHMPKEAARIFLKVTGVRVERLWDMTESDAVKEGFVDDRGLEYWVGNTAEGNFLEMWDTTIKKDQLQYYGWNANPYVWVIKFETIDRETALKEGQP